ncbi:MAG: hypothetical protein HY589_04325, partial [Candidatus Omnitrophica bacterium]|nr:hypothetical protein [Candidatus Omnitrophota bacterium]
PVFGKFTERYIGSPLYGVSYTEHALYLGWVPLILAFIAWKRWRKGRKDPRGDGAPRRQLSESDKFYIGFFIWLAIAALLFSQPPYFTFPYFKIYTPSFFMYKILPMFRAYCRFGVVVMFAVSVLAGSGLKFIISNIRNQKAKILAASLLCALALFEFWNWPPFKVIDLAKYPKAYDWLKQQKGDFVIAEYPLDTEGPNEYYKFCQTIHEKKIINGTIPGTYPNRVARSMWRLSDPRTPRVLSWMKVRYVLAHLNSYAAYDNIQMLDEFEEIKDRKIEGARFVGTFDEVDVYEIAAAPAEPGAQTDL